MSPVDAPVARKPHTANDFKSDQEVRWCPGCGDYAILNQFRKLLASLDTPRENHVLVSGIGCSSRFPYYVDCYGIHSIHGRAPTLATGIKTLRPDLTVWVITGDGDGLSIGASHLLHTLRRNVDLKILLFNNRIYGLTKGQYSPTSEMGKRTKSTPLGSIESPIEPVRLALTAGATFVARTVDTNGKHLQQTLQQVAAHRGAAFVEIYQNCPVFNDGAFEGLNDSALSSERTLLLEAGEPLRFGADNAKALALDERLMPVIVAADHPRVLRMNPTSAPLAYLLARLPQPDFPVPLGVFHAVSRPTYEEGVTSRIGAHRAIERERLQALLEGGQSWHIGDTGG
jgi:2-oxoglutarate ferredoxin oxidoreductase subunit beta